jgi:glutathione synthase
VWVLDTRDTCRRPWSTRSLTLAREFLAEHGEIVVKPLHGNGGKAVFKVGRNGENLASLIEVFNTAYREPHVVQASSRRSPRATSASCWSTARSRRGQPHPGEGEIRSNLAVGGKAAEDRADRARAEICARSGPS